MPGFHMEFPGECSDVPATHAGYRGPVNNIELARIHRYLLQVFNPVEGLNRAGEPTFIGLYLNQCSRPSIEIDEIVIHNGQDEIYRPGKTRWKPINFTFYEVLGDDNNDYTAELLFRWWAEEVIKLQESKIASPAQLNKNIELDMLDGSGQTIWTYALMRCWPTAISPRDMTYTGSEISEVEATVRFDKAVEHKMDFAGLMSGGN